MSALVREVPFKFQVGERTLFSLSLPLQMRQVTLGEAIAMTGAVEPPAEPPVPGSQGFGIRALPVSAPQPPMRRSGAYLCYVQDQYRRFYIDLRIGFDAYKAKFSSKTRSTLLRKVNRYAAHCGGTVPWRIFKAPAEMMEFHRLARHVSARTYQEKLLDAGLPDSPEFIAEMTSLAHAGQVRGYVLFDGERPVSYLYCPAREGTLIYAFLGYDPEYLKMSVGTVLQWLALESIFSEGVFTLFDFTEGESDHKRLFATNEMACANVYFVADSLSNRVLVQAHHGFDRLVGQAGDVVDRLGWKKKIKRVLRFGIASPAARAGTADG